MDGTGWLGMKYKRRSIIEAATQEQLLGSFGLVGGAAAAVSGWSISPAVSPVDRMLATPDAAGESSVLAPPAEQHSSPEPHVLGFRKKVLSRKPLDGLNKGRR